MRNAGLEEAPAGIKIAGRNINNLSYADGTPPQYSCLENPMDGDPGRLLSMGSHRVGHDWSDLADDTTLKAESEEELKSLFMKVREWKS